MDALRCPRCTTGLKELELGEVLVEGCPSCGGTLVEQRELVQLLQVLAATLLQILGPDAAIVSIEDTYDTATCPDCEGPMVKYGYQGSKQVVLDRCPKCMLLWLDGGELEVMAQLFLRSEKSFQANVDKIQELAEYLRPANYHGDLAEWATFYAPHKGRHRALTAMMMAMLDD